jgi:hypothetical protein
LLFEGHCDPQAVQDTAIKTPPDSAMGGAIIHRFVEFPVRRNIRPIMVSACRGDGRFAAMKTDLRM